MCKKTEAGWLPRMGRKWSSKMKTMKKMMTLLAVVGMVFALTGSAQAQAVNIFTADFEGSALGLATKANLELGTVGATWEANVPEEASIEVDGGSQIFNPDAGIYDFDINFTSTSLVGSEFSYDAYQQRSNGANALLKRPNFITGYDSDGDEVFSVFLSDDDSGTSNSTIDPNGRFSYVNFAGNAVEVANGLFTSGGGEYEDGHFESFRLEFNATDYAIFVGGSLITNGEYRNAVGTGAGEINGLATITFDATRVIPDVEFSTNSGAFYDNLSLDGAGGGSTPGTLIYGK
jgi:hypothetical protein